MAKIVNPSRHVDNMKTARRLLSRTEWISTLQELLSTDEDPRLRIIGSLLKEDEPDPIEYFAYGKPVSSNWLLKLGKLYNDAVITTLDAIDELKSRGFEIVKHGRFKVLGDIMTTEGVMETARGFGDVTDIGSAVKILQDQGFDVSQV